MQTRLINTTGKSNKEYNVSIEPLDGGYVVNFAYGAIGKALKAGTKTASPVDLDKAEKVAEKLLKSKMSKGYVLDSTSDDSINTLPNSKEVIFNCQLSNPVKSTDELEKHIDLSEGAFVSLKKDGERRVVILNHGVLSSTNRKGEMVPLSSSLQIGLFSLFEELEISNIILDCEDMGSHLYIFDILQLGDHDLRSKPFIERQALLAGLNLTITKPHLSSVKEVIGIARHDFVKTATEIQALSDESRKNGEEGLVIKSANSLYEAGRPNSGGTVFKMKNVNDLQAVVVARHPSKRSASLAVFDGDKQVDIGNCTIPANIDETLIQEGVIVNVGYLWVQEVGGSLIQPSMQRIRTDLDAKDCGINQIVYRGEMALSK